LISLLSIAMVLGIIYLNITQWLNLIAIAILGLLYAHKWYKEGETPFMLKKVFLLKNLMIGVGWGLLVLIGYGQFESKMVNAITAFASLQVVVGSIMRDLKDRDRDIGLEYNTLPVVLGQSKTILISHFVNVLSLIPLLFTESFSLLPYLGIVVLWRLLLLEGIRRNGPNDLWAQKLNLASCVLILIMISIYEFY
jgi:4-hydroxybenzoate polyprenyltransferase